MHAFTNETRTRVSADDLNIKEKQEELIFRRSKFRNGFK